jgi:hypothetical protein
MAARIAELEARVTKGGALRFKVSEEGAVSVYGLGRFPVTLYLEQRENLLSHTDELRQFIESNRAHLKIRTKSRILNAFMTQRVNGAYFKLCLRFGSLS